MRNLKSLFATSSSATSYIFKLEILNQNTKFYVRLLFAFTVYHTFFSGNSYNLITPVFLSGQNTNEYRYNRNYNGKYHKPLIIFRIIYFRQFVVLFLFLRNKSRTFPLQNVFQELPLFDFDRNCVRI